MIKHFMKYIYLFLIYSILLPFNLFSQTGILKGSVKDAYTNEAIPFVNIIVFGTTTGTMTDTLGQFEFNQLPTGFIRLQLSSVGYKPLITAEFNISQIRTNFVEIKMESATESLDEIQITASPFAQKPEAPVSLRRIGIDQIEKSAGANRDISKVLQSFPGVASSVTYRNDLIVRGGGPSENRFYLDDIEIPTINHFATQGASGGPVGILNVDFIREVDFYSSAFPVSKSNALSSVLEFKQIDVNNDKANFKGTLGASEISLTSTAPLGEKTGLIASVRRSYLQFLFDALGLPFLPTFTDFQVKTKTRLDTKNEISFIGVGAIDDFALNPSPEATEENQYILSYIPVNEQWNYTIGSSWKHYLEKSYFTLVASRNHLHNRAYKYQNNIEKPENLITDYTSYEIENKLRLEYTARPNDFTINIGSGLEYALYSNKTFNKTFIGDRPKEVNFSSELNLFKWFFFGSVSHPFFNNRLSLSASVRLDANNYSAQMNNLPDQFSPRIAASYMLFPDFYINANAGRYYQNPAYTLMGFRNNAGELVNQSNGLKYIRADHYVAGLEYRPNDHTRFTLEGFLKNYDHYPLSVNDSISMASKGGDYGVFGNEEVTPDSKGRAYGVEALVQTRSNKGLSLTSAYTYVRSEFTDYQDTYIPSSWDSRHIFTITLNQKLKRNWDIGFKWRYLGGLPYTPYDEDQSSLVLAWDAQGREYLDYSQFNTKRLPAFHQLDIRIDKSYTFKKFALGFYIDIQNVYNNQAEQAPRLIQVKDSSGDPIVTNPGSSLEEQRYQLKELTTTSGTILPTIGLMFEF